MGQKESKYDLTDEKLFEAEDALMRFSGLPPDQIETQNVEVDQFEGKPVFLRTIKCGLKSENKPILVLTHGYGGSCPLFYKILKKLVSKFYLIMFDLPGMGGSSKPDNFDVNLSPKQVIEYFVGYIEKWRLKMEITDFYLTAHSYGGYICGHYAVKYHQHVKKLLLLSPIGTKEPRPE